MQTPDLERRVLRHTLLVFALVTLAFWLVNGLSLAEEWRRAGETGGWLRALTLEATSNLVLVLLFVPVALLERRFPVTLERWRTALPVHALGAVIFSAVHVSVMNGLRMGLWPSLFGFDYEGLGGVLGEFGYEFRKDALSYGLILAMLALFRELEDARQRLKAAREDARTDHVITLRSGGREIRLPAREILSASAAGNYVEVRTQTGEHLARMTLTRLISLLQSAGADPVRLHRSHMACRPAIRELVPTGDGDAEARLSDGRILPVSRGFRAAV
ncbi:MAG: LytTR family transcriptional regulator [Oceanicaulis sp.]|uniref:LytR/AlgR family response regulator transcription factor n=1 Tax=unclassified Oceanicaulis TaxID=2632123 RepID=UPI00006697DB|nr:MULTISPECIES: LytTR family DNA-binding domain-containing protein [unclassified Oceanicaulis]EAP89656.1 probable regulatory protein [Oceanicaulis sp. HTCC2633]MAB70563.1 LytTR family transcriptional regulator [Oceanicaulis sp.]MBC38669.1 LytTR family transcriptional regulator [Oceanicaulis sp.]MBG36374.1 LytTR family transcriptional regulator [Oceanicaulis sp.]HBU63466.1 LytTR family transcriptional regulator [Oceanicaulis sp.]|tara:strand:+ start:2192 stop:3013 length:822 start_codon:yes stop_codon:yes gene_type:complete